jgi:hypothetical protein
MKYRREFLFLALFTLCLVAFIGCGKKTDKDKPGDDLVIEALVGIGSVQFGMSKEEVMEHIGQPDQISGKGTELNYIASKGLSLTVPPDVGMQKIKCWSENWPTKLPFVVTTFTGKTVEGIGMGATQEQIVTAYGQPDRQDTKEVLKNLYYDSLQAKFTLSKDELVAMILEAPK